MFRLFFPFPHEQCFQESPIRAFSANFCRDGSSVMTKTKAMSCYNLPSVVRLLYFLRTKYVYARLAAEYVLPLSSSLYFYFREAVMDAGTKIYRNGIIITMDSHASEVEAVAVRGDRIFAVGRDSAIMSLKEKDTVVVDLGGRVMLPGFIDGHSHFMMTAELYGAQMDFSSPPVGDVRSIGEILSALRAKAAETPRGSWVRGFGYDDTLLEEKRHPLAKELDKACPEHPVILQHVSGHLFTCNSLALKMAGIDRNTPDPVGGVIRRDESGAPNGVLEEPPASDMATRLVPPMTRDDWMRSVGIASEAYVAKGVTSAQEGYASDLIWDMLCEAHVMPDSPLKPRVQVLPEITLTDVSRFGTTKSGTQLTKDCMLGLGAVKMLADGSLQCYTGYLSNPYHNVIYDLPGGALWRGYPIQPAHELTKTVCALHQAGWQIAVHGNGDAAIQDILDAYEEAQKRYPRADARHIIVHCQTVREDQLDRIKRLGVIPSFFVVHTYFWGDRHYETFLGQDRAERINPLRSALNREILFSTHNDTFVTPIDPLLSVWSAVNRTTSGGRTLGVDQKIPVLDALRSVTSWAAYQACEEHLKGSLEPGKLADMVVLEDNPLTVVPEAIKDIGVAASIVGGRTVFGDL